MEPRIIGISHRVKRRAEGKEHPTQVAVLQNGHFHGYDLKTEDDELNFVRGTHQLGTELTDGLSEGDNIAMILGGSGDNFAYALARRGVDIGAYVFRVPPIIFAQYKAANNHKNDAQALAALFWENSEVFYPVGPRNLKIIWLRESLYARNDAMKARIACEQRLRQRLIGTIFCSPDGFFPEGSIEKAFDAQKASDPVYSPLAKEEDRRNAQLTKACEELPVYNEVFRQVTGCGPMIASRIIAATVDIRRFLVEPDAVEMAESKAESIRLEKEAKLEADTRFVTKMIQPEMSHYDIIKLVRDWKRQMGKEKEAQLLEKSLALHEQRSKMRRNAMNKSIARFQAFCGVHVRDGEFPRRRNNQTANWHNDCRMAFYLLGDQFNRRPETYWGQRLREIKENYRLKHPEPIVADRKLTQMFRKMEVFFRSHGVQIQPKDYKVVTIDGLYEWFRASCTELGNKAEYLQDEIATWEEEIDNAQLSGSTVKVFTAGHIHKMSLWNTLNKFAKWLFREWAKLEKAGVNQEAE